MLNNWNDRSPVIELQIFFVVFMLFFETMHTFCRCLLSHSLYIVESSVFKHFYIYLYFFFCSSFSFPLYLHNAVIKWPFSFPMLGVLCTKVMEYIDHLLMVAWTPNIVLALWTFNIHILMRRMKKTIPIVFIYTHLLRRYSMSVKSLAKTYISMVDA